MKGPPQTKETWVVGIYRITIEPEYLKKKLSLSINRPCFYVFSFQFLIPGLGSSFPSLS